MHQHGRGSDQHNCTSGDRLPECPLRVIHFHPVRGRERAAGVDTGQIVIRGGDHLDFTDAPGSLPATLRGLDMTAWYTNAWFLKYLKGSKRGDAMLKSNRWWHDAVTGSIDPAKDPNLLSWHFRSRMDITSAGKRWRCEDLRAGCRGQTTATNDGLKGAYSFVKAR